MLALAWALLKEVGCDTKHLDGYPDRGEGEKDKENSGEGW